MADFFWAPNNLYGRAVNSAFQEEADQHVYEALSSTDCLSFSTTSKWDTPLRQRVDRAFHEHFLNSEAAKRTFLQRVRHEVPTALKKSISPAILTFSGTYVAINLSTVFSAIYPFAPILAFAAYKHVKRRNPSQQKRLFQLERDILETFSHLLSILAPETGNYYLEKSQFERNCYNINLSRFYNRSNFPTIQKDFFKKAFDSLFSEYLFSSRNFLENHPTILDYQKYFSFGHYERLPVNYWEQLDFSQDLLNDDDLKKLLFPDWIEIDFIPNQRKSFQRIQTLAFKAPDRFEAFLTQVLPDPTFHANRIREVFFINSDELDPTIRAFLKRDSIRNLFQTPEETARYESFFRPIPPQRDNHSFRANFWEAPPHKEATIQTSKLSKKEAFEILNLKTAATLDQEKNAYKKLAMKHHPDRILAQNGGVIENWKETQEKFQKIVEAHQACKDNPDWFN